MSQLNGGTTVIGGSPDGIEDGGGQGGGVLGPAGGAGGGGEEGGGIIGGVVQPGGVRGGGEGGGAIGSNTGGADPASWRRRAVAAEEKAREIERSLAELRASLEESRAKLRAAELRRELETALLGSGAIDLETTVLLTEHEMSQNPGWTVKRAVESLRTRKPFLFGAPGDEVPGRVPRGSSSGTGVMGMEARGTGGGQVMEEVVGKAKSGDRNALLRYMRARRQG